MEREEIVYENVLENQIINNALSVLDNKTPNSEENVEKSDEEKEIELLNVLYNFKEPLESGVLTSGFGDRNINEEEEYHTGIDLAAEKGTYIKSSITGIVTLISSDGNYR